MGGLHAVLPAGGLHRPQTEIVVDAAPTAIADWVDSFAIIFTLAMASKACSASPVGGHVAPWKPVMPSNGLGEFTEGIRPC